MPTDNADERAKDAAEGQSMPVPPAGTTAADGDIAARAYELYQSRGGEHGRDWEDWLEAERQLSRRTNTPGPTPS